MESLCIERLVSSVQINERKMHIYPFEVLRTRSPINRIPNEILLRIFKYHLNPVDLLSSCLQVNRKWKKLIEDKSMWKTVNPINWAKSLFFSFNCCRSVENVSKLNLKINGIRMFHKKTI